MRRLPTIVLALALALAPALTACGGERTGARPPSATGAPLWRVDAALAEAEADAGLLRVRTPIRLLLLTEGFDPEGERRTLASLDVAAGRTVRIQWSAEAASLPKGGELDVPEAEAGAGRTVPFGAYVHAEIDHDALYVADDTLWTRPTRGRAFVQSALPPAQPEALALGTEIELAAAAVVDAETEDASLRLVGGRSRVRLRPERPGDRSRVLRLILRVEAR